MGHGRTILIVDDDPALIRTFARMLQVAGYTVATALDAESGWREFVRVKPDAVLIDLRLTSIDGLALLQCLRADETGQQTPVAMITGDMVLDEQVSRQLHDLKAQVYFKPLWLDELLQIAERLTAGTDPA